MCLFKANTDVGWEEGRERVGRVSCLLSVLCAELWASFCLLALRAHPLVECWWLFAWEEAEAWVLTLMWAAWAGWWCGPRRRGAPPVPRSAWTPPAPSGPRSARTASSAAPPRCAAGWSRSSRGSASRTAALTSATSPSAAKATVSAVSLRESFGCQFWRWPPMTAALCELHGLGQR